ncbi:hypothetical protein DKM19_33245 [Streptosporangium sp. 'caverna']|nr:hypothetical protein DKM19_33245 [Streptosporangium sp. 'caverna']
MSYRGVGAKVIRLKAADKDAIWLASFIHSGSSNFIVSPIDPQGAEQASIINEIGNYKGTTIFNVDNGTEAGGLKIEADGTWSLRLKPLSMARAWAGPKASGRGDDVLKLDPQSSGLTTVQARHSGSSNFIVDSYAENGGEGLINEIGSWKGEVLLPDGTKLVTIKADGTWSFVRS